MIKSSFFEYLLINNQPQMEGFARWILHRGMLFNALETWWGDKKPRPSPHEGLDLCCFEDSSHQVKRIDKSTRIPATFAGEVLHIIPDFLGISIFLGHEILGADGRRLCTAYGHTRPFGSLKVGTKVMAGELIAVIGAGPGKQSRVLPHLHLTLAWLPVTLASERLTWPNLGQDRDITLIDPLAILAPPAGLL